MRGNYGEHKMVMSILSIKAILRLKTRQAAPTGGSHRNLPQSKIDEAVRTFRKIYLGVVDQFIDYLNTGDGRPPILKRPSKKTSRDVAGKVKRNRGLD